jgi:hypothetical protein
MDRFLGTFFGLFFLERLLGTIPDPYFWGVEVQKLHTEVQKLMGYTPKTRSQRV